MNPKELEFNTLVPGTIVLYRPTLSKFKIGQKHWSDPTSWDLINEETDLIKYSPRDIVAIVNLSFWTNSFSLTRPQDGLDNWV